MRNKQNIYNRFTFKLCINALSIFFLSLMVLQIHAEEKPVDIKTIVDKLLLPNIESNKSEVVVEEIPADIRQQLKRNYYQELKLTSLI